MTDFIHEPPREPRPQKPEPELSPGKRQKRVYLYIAILFTAAFVLILWSFLASQRSSELMLKEIRSNSDLMESTLAENQSLEAEIAALTQQLQSLQQQNDTLQEQLKTTQQSLDELTKTHERSLMALSALDWLCKIESCCSAGDAEQARAMVLAFEETGLSPYLWEIPMHTFEGNDAEAPAAAYARVCAMLFPDGLPR